MSNISKCNISFKIYNYKKIINICKKLSKITIFILKLYIHNNKEFDRIRYRTGLFLN